LLPPPVAALRRRPPPTPCSRALQASCDGRNLTLTRGCSARCAWREGGGFVARARAPFDYPRLMSQRFI